MRGPIHVFHPEFPGKPEHTALTLAYTTDTAIPQPVVPIYVIHSLETPFCDETGCACQGQKAQKALLLSDIADGTLIVRREGGQL